MLRVGLEVKLVPKLDRIRRDGEPLLVDRRDEQSGYGLGLAVLILIRRRVLMIGMDCVRRRRAGTHMRARMMMMMQ